MVNGGWKLLLYDLSPFINLFENMAIFSLFFFPFLFCIFLSSCVQPLFLMLGPSCVHIFFSIAPCLFCKDTFGERGHGTCGALFVEWIDGTMLTLT
jgi:hypothetical protein